MRNISTMVGSRAVFCFLLSCSMSLSTPFLDGRFVATSNVSGLLGLSLDISAINEVNNPQVRESIYSNGQNAYTINAINGERETLSLASLSLDATTGMNRDALFVLVRQFYENQGFMTDELKGSFSGRPANEFANTLLADLRHQNDPSFEAEAILVLTLWFATSHELYQVLHNCYIDHNATSSLISLDQAMSLWIGQDQVTGNSTSGHMLYRLAEIAGERFGQSDEFGESWANQRILELANSIQIGLSIGLECSPNTESNTIKDQVMEILDKMSIPLIQNAVHHVLIQTTGDPDYAQLYSYTVLPRIAACDPSLVTDLNVISFPLMSSNRRTEWVKTVLDNLSCFRLTCGDIGFHGHQNSPECTDAPMPAVLAGYIANSPTAQQFSYIDRDIFQISIFMQAEAIEAAYDLYSNGYNSLFSLQQVALNEIVPGNSRDVFNMFKNYYSSEDSSFINNEILAALYGENVFESTSSIQRQEIVLGILKYEALYLAAETAFEHAIWQCWNDDFEAAIHYWDMGAAFYIGSYEKRIPGGGNGGQLLHGVSKRLCRKFGTCEDETHGNNSRANRVIIDALSLGSNRIIEQDCHGSQHLFNEFVSPFLKIPLIQGAIAAANDSNQLPKNSPDEVIGTAHAFSRSILPFVNQVDESSARILARNLLYNNNETHVSDGIQVVASAFRTALPLMGIDCANLGNASFTPLIFCEPRPEQQNEMENDLENMENTLNNTNATMGDSVDDDLVVQTPLAFGRYNFSFEETAHSFASIALDVRDMLNANSTQEARRIYAEGANAVKESALVGELLTLASFSTEAGIMMSEDPMFNIFKFALYDDQTLEDANEGDFTYANEIVLEAFESTSNIELASEASVVLNVWMMVAHQLYDAERSCRRQGNPEEHIDIAVALWIGENQSEGGTNEGWLLYNLAQDSASKFGFDEGESSINSKIMAQFLDVQSVARRCTEDASIADTIRLKIVELLRSLSIPLIQQLLFGIVTDDKWHTELYASAVVSQFAGCNPDVYTDLSEVFYSGFSIGAVNESVVENIALFLKCLRISCGDLEYTPNAPPALQELVSQLCQYLDLDSSVRSQYHLNNDVYEQARIDLDTLQIGIFMRTKAYEAAMDYYFHGQNSITLGIGNASGDLEASLASLQGLTMLPDDLRSEQLDIFLEYFGSHRYMDNIILQCFQRSGLFRGASRTELYDAVKRILQVMVSYRAIVTKLTLSIKTCRNGDEQGAIDNWDSAVAIFVGSTNSFLATETLHDGVTFHSLFLELCQIFGTCAEVNGTNSSSNPHALFQEGHNLLHANRCDEADELMGLIVLKLQIPIVQGILSHTFSKYGNVTSNSYQDTDAGGYIFSQSILPLIDDANPSSATRIANAFHSPLNNTIGPVAAENVFEAIKDALPQMNIDCGLIGRIESRPDLSLCTQFNLPHAFQGYEGIGLDVAQMRAALLRGQDDLALQIYTQGTNVVRMSVGGGTTIKYSNLQSLSTVATDEMTEEPVFNLFRFHFGKTASVRTATSTYADQFVREAFENKDEDSITLAADAAVVLNVWMYFVHNIYKSLSICREELSQENAINAINEAAAFWLGDVGVNASDPNGHLLFSLSAEMQTRFQQEFVPFNVNEEILEKLNDFKNYLEEPESCTSDSMNFSQRFELAHEIVSLATVPIIQGLVHNLRTDKKDHSRLFATALVPLLSACNPDDYNFLKSKLLEQPAINAIETDAIIDAVYGTLPCLGLKCTQVGVHSSEFIGGSVDVSNKRCEIIANQTATVAGYRPQKEFEKYAPLDLDLSEVNILMQMEAYSAAKDILLHGKHASVSLLGLSSLSQRGKNNHFDELFTTYFGTENYAHDLVMHALENDYADKSLTDHQRRIFVLRFAQVLALEHAALDMVFSSVEACEEDTGGDHEAVHAPWDAAAGLLIGSINRTTASSMTWFAPFDLAQEYCQEFGVCIAGSNDGGIEVVAQANKQMLELLYAGRGAAISGSSCGGLRKIAGELASLLSVPIIQATLSASIRLTSSPSGHTSEDLAMGYVFSRSIIPRIKEVDTSVATSIEDTLTLNPKSIEKLTGEYMFSLFHSVYEDLGVECEAVGMTTEYNACYVAAPASSPTTTMVSAPNGKDGGGSHPILFIGLALAAFGLIIIAGVLYWRRQQQRENSTELSRGRGLVRSKYSNKRLRKSYRDGSRSLDPFLRKRGMSPKASRLLDLILSYGDDADVGIDPTMPSTAAREEQKGFISTSNSSNILPQKSYDGEERVNIYEDSISRSDSSVSSSSTDSSERGALKGNRGSDNII